MELVRNIESLDLDRLQEVLDYEPETGALIWRIRLSPRSNPGQRAGCVKKDGYRKITIDKKNYHASHLAWFHFYGVQPRRLIDHENTIRDDDRIENLREATHSQNSMNQKRNVRNTTGFKGVSVNNAKWNRAKFRSSIRFDGKRIFIGLFHTADNRASLTREDIHMGSMLDEWDRLSNDERGSVRLLCPAFVDRLEKLKAAVDRL